MNCWTGTVFEEREEKKESIGTVVVRLYDEVTPMTAHKFREWCMGCNGVGYEGSLIRRIVPSFVIQAGFVPEGTRVSGVNLKGGPIGCFIGSVLKAGWEMKFLLGATTRRVFYRWWTWRKTWNFIFIWVLMNFLMAVVLCSVGGTVFCIRWNFFKTKSVTEQAKWWAKMAWRSCGGWRSLVVRMAV